MICICRREYSGSLSQFRRPSIHLSLAMNPQYRGAVIQYFRIDFISLHLNLVDQRIFLTLPENLKYFHSNLQTTLPEVVIAKLYSSDENSVPADLYLLSVHLNVSFINGTTQISPINRCEHIRTFSSGTLVIFFQI